MEKANPTHLSALNEEIRFNHISFSYNGQTQVLNDINLRIQKGETIALVGQSGSGKSTWLIYCRDSMMYKKERF